MDEVEGVTGEDKLMDTCAIVVTPSLKKTSQITSQHNSLPDLNIYYKEK
jgi:hypothetical protein